MNVENALSSDALHYLCIDTYSTHTVLQPTSLYSSTTIVMPIPKSDYLSNVWRDGVFTNKVVFCTGGNGSICSAQVRALVHLGADACIVGRNAEKTAAVAKDIATARSGAKVLGFGNIDVRSVESLQKAADQCAKELGGIDFLMYAQSPCQCTTSILTPSQRRRGRQLPRTHVSTQRQCVQDSYGH